MTVALMRSARAPLAGGVTDEAPRSSDDDAVREARRDWNALYEAMRPRLHGLALAMLHQQQDAEDAVQEVFLRAWRHAHRLRDVGALEGWMFAVLRNVARDRLRRRRIRRADPLDADWVPEPIETRRLRPDSRLELDDALAALPVRCRGSLDRTAAGETLRELAVREGVTYTAARTRLCRARSRLRIVLSG